MATEAELREAAERLSRYELADWQGLSGKHMDMRAGIMLASTYLAENNPDRSLPATAEWLLTLDGADVDGHPHVPLVDGYWLSKTPTKWILWIEDESIILWPGQTVTRGMVLDLMAALKGGG